MSVADECRIPWQETCWTCDVKSLNFQCTDELTPLDHFIGQDRALEAIRFGLEVDKPGYNLFVTGLTGTGKATAIKSHLQSIVEDLERLERQRPISDWVYVYNFEDPDRPRALRLPVGIGKAFRSHLSEIPNLLKDEIPKVLQSEDYEVRRRAIEDAGRKDGQEVMSELEREAQGANFALKVTPSGITLFPMLDNRPMTPEEYQALEAEQKQAIDKTRERLMQIDPGCHAQDARPREGNSREFQNAGTGGGEPVCFRSFPPCYRHFQRHPKYMGVPDPSDRTRPG